MQKYANAVCFSGTHGKTTTTSMATHIFMEAGADPTVMIGGTLPLLHSGYRVGQGIPSFWSPASTATPS